MHTGWSRRAVLGGAAAVVAGLAGCTDWQDGSDPSPPDPLEPLLAATSTLVSRYEQAIAEVPALADRLTPLLATHQEHVRVIRAMIGRPEPSATPDGMQWVEPSETAERSEEDVLAELRAAEEAGQQAATDACLAAPPDRAPLLGSIAAARASHQVVLR
ncbi:MAG TPA: hypothetical protein VKZ67_09595 [Natronosporangium sp.]|nr:hypothetical protein [Natronosporangium sp.]